MTFYIKSHYYNNTERRKFIRETWGSKQNLFFIVSRNSIDSKNIEPLDAESEDMLILENLEETIENFSFKIAAAVKHGSRCKQHAVITDDDVFWWPHKLESFLKNMKQDEATLFGNRHYFEAPVRTTHTEWARYLITYEEYQYSVFPPFCNGSGYVITNKALQLMVEELSQTVLLRHVDDAWAGTLAWNAGVEVEHNKNFHKGMKSSGSCEDFNFHDGQEVTVMWKNKFRLVFLKCDFRSEHIPDLLNFAHFPKSKKSSLVKTLKTVFSYFGGGVPSPLPEMPGTYLIN